MADPRIKFILSKLSENLNFSSTEVVENWFQKASQEEVSKITEFFQAEGPPAIFFYTFSREPLHMKVSDNPSEYPDFASFKRQLETLTLTQKYGNKSWQAYIINNKLPGYIDTMIEYEY